MVYAKVIDGAIAQYPWSWEQMRAENPEVLFPAAFSMEIFASYGGVVVEFGTAPSYDAWTQELQEGTPTLVNGVWTRTWNVVDLSPEMAQQIQDAQRAANRETAKQALIDTDWCEMPSVRNTQNTPHLTNGAEFDAYRLAMRAITLDPPLEVTNWPTKPSGAWA